MKAKRTTIETAVDALFQWIAQGGRKPGTLAAPPPEPTPAPAAPMPPGDTTTPYVLQNPPFNEAPTPTDALPETLVGRTSDGHLVRMTKSVHRHGDDAPLYVTAIDIGMSGESIAQDGAVVHVFPCRDLTEATAVFENAQRQGRQTGVSILGHKPADMTEGWYMLHDRDDRPEWYEAGEIGPVKRPMRMQ